MTPTTTSGCSTGSTGSAPTALFDTRIAAQLLNEPGIGLAALLEKYLGVRLDKRFQRADWSARPLSAEMLAYAASDTRHLPELRDILAHQLEARGRLDWAEEEFGLLDGIRAADPNGAEPGCLRLKGAKALRGRELAMLREVWRMAGGCGPAGGPGDLPHPEQRADAGDRQAPPGDLAALKTIPGIGGDQAERRGREILAAVQRGLELPEDQLPRIERPPRRQPDPAFEARLERLKARRNVLAVRLDLAPGVLCPNGTLEAIARANPAGVEALQAVPELRRWQAREIGPSLFAALQEEQPAAG